MIARKGRFRLRFLVGLVILVEIIFGFLYAVNTPRWEAPDEPAQFNYVRHIAETGTLPVLNSGDYDQEYLEKIKALKFPPTFSIDSIRYESYEPPLYYMLAAPVYLAARAAGLDAVLALRLLSVGLGGILLLLAYRVFAQVFPTRPMLSAAATGLMAAVPMHVAMGAAINADSLAEVLLAAVFLISLARAGGRLGDRRFVLLGGIVFGLVLLTSIKIYASVVLILFAEVRFRAGGLGAKTWKTILPLLAVSLVLSSWWFIRNALLYGGDIFGLARHDAVVIGQPTTADWIVKYGLKNTVADFFIITFKSFWAQFGWMGVLVSDRIYVGLLVLTIAAVLGVSLLALRKFRLFEEKGWRPSWVWALLGLWLMVAALDLVLYNLRYFQPQGRYLFPALIPISALGVIGLYELFDKRHAALLFALVYAAMLVLDYVSLFWFIVPQLRI